MAAASAVGSEVGVGSPSPWRALPVVMVGTFMAILDVFIVLVAAPAIQGDLRASDAAIQSVLAGYQLAYAAMLITAARLGDLYGRKRLFMTGLALFTLASLVCGAAPTALVLILARLAQGVGAGLLVPQVFALISVLAPEEQRPRAFGALGATMGLSTMVGQVLGGLLIHADVVGTSWRPVFWINVPIGVMALTLAARMVPESRAPGVRRLDLPGMAALTVAVFLLIFPLIQGREAGWPAWTWACLVCSAVAFAGFAVVERRVEGRGGTPLVSLTLLRQRSFVVGIALVVLLYASLNSFFLVLSLTLQDGLGRSALNAGLVYAPDALAFIVGSLLAGRLAKRHARRVLHVGAVTTAVGFATTAIVAYTQGSQITSSAIIPTLVVQGFGQGLLVTPLLNQILAHVGVNHLGSASGALSTAQQVGGALGIALVGVFYFAALGDASPHQAQPYAHALGIAVLLHLALATTIALLLFILPQPEHRPPPATQ